MDILSESYYNSTAASHISLLYQLKEKNVFYNVGIIEKEIYDNENLLSSLLIFFSNVINILVTVFQLQFNKTIRSKYLCCLRICSIVTLYYTFYSDPPPLCLTRIITVMLCLLCKAIFIVRATACLKVQ